MLQVTNKCKDEDLEYYIRECGEILNVTTSLPLKSRTAKHILEFILAQLVEFKKLNQVTLARLNKATDIKYFWQYSLYIETRCRCYST